MLSQVLQLQWHLREFFFLTAVGLITFLASALVLWSNLRASQMAAVPTALSLSYMMLLIYLAVRYYLLSLLSKDAAIDTLGDLHHISSGSIMIS